VDPSKFRPELARSDADLVARAMDVLGERWTVMILRQAFFGVRRFNQIQRNLGISRNVLAERLQNLVGAGVLKREQYRSDPDHYEYHLTEKGLDLFPSIVAIMRWGDKYLAGESGSPLLLMHTECGRNAAARMTCSACGGEITAHNVLPVPGPGAKPAQ
jgi:DNA-binding HxlR family transcriptional regulator